MTLQADEHTLLEALNGTKMSADAFRQLPESNQFMELINGELYMSPSPKSFHQDIAFNIAFLLRQQIPHGKIVIAPMDFYMDGVNVYQPDVFWLAENSPCVERDGYYYGAPELVVEVHSPATVKQDKDAKFDVYQRVGVLEYWLVDPIGHIVEVWSRTKLDEAWQRRGVFGADETFASVAMSKDITMTGIFPQDDKPEASQEGKTGEADETSDTP
jgi:Uma2 family endonuclease